jgi:hypothetical protein
MGVGERLRGARRPGAAPRPGVPDERNADPRLQRRRRLHPRVPRRRGRHLDPGPSRYARPRADRRHAAAAEVPHLRQRPGVHWLRVRRLGAPSRRARALHPARKADRERLRRELQRQAPRRVPQRELVRHDGGREVEARGVEARLQPGPPALRAGQPHAVRFCSASPRPAVPGRGPRARPRTSSSGDRSRNPARRRC